MTESLSGNGALAAFFVAQSSDHVLDSKRRGAESLANLLLVLASVGDGAEFLELDVVAGGLRLVDDQVTLCLVEEVLRQVDKGLHQANEHGLALWFELEEALRDPAQGVEDPSSIDGQIVARLHLPGVVAGKDGLNDLEDLQLDLRLRNLGLGDATEQVSTEALVHLDDRVIVIHTHEVAPPLPCALDLGLLVSDVECQVLECHEPVGNHYHHESAGLTAGNVVQAERCGAALRPEGRIDEPQVLVPRRVGSVLDKGGVVDG